MSSISCGVFSALRILLADFAKALYLAFSLLYSLLCLNALGWSLIGTPSNSSSLYIFNSFSANIKGLSTTTSSACLLFTPPAVATIIFIDDSKYLYTVVSLSLSSIPLTSLLTN